MTTQPPGEPQPYAARPFAEPDMDLPPNPYGVEPGASPYYGPPPGAYGAPINPYGPPYYPMMPPVARPRRDGMGIAALVCGILGLTLVPGICSLIAVILGHLALGAARRGETSSRGPAIAGLVTGYIGVAFWAMIFLLFGMVFGALDSTFEWSHDVFEFLTRWTIF